MQETLAFFGERINDYMQFYYGNKAWASQDTNGDAKCRLNSDDWGKDPMGCPNAMAAVRIPSSKVSQRPPNTLIDSPALLNANFRAETVPCT